MIRWRWLLVGLATACQGAAEPKGPGSEVELAPEQETATSEETDPPVRPARLRWMLHGGGAEEATIFGAFVEAADFGRVVTLGAVDDETDPDLRFWDDYFVGLGAREAVTVNTPTEADGDDVDLAGLLEGANGVFFRGGDQSRYVAAWWGHAVGAALEQAWTEGAVFGGSSAGCAILGERIYDARVGSADPWEVLLDARNRYMTYSHGLTFGVPGVITDTHFTERGRLPRLAAFVATWQMDLGQARLGIGVDPQTALFLREDRTGFVMGDGAVTLLRVPLEGVFLPSGDPPHIPEMPMWQLPAGYEVDLDAVDPVIARPAWVSAAVSTSPSGPLMPGDLDGSATDSADLGSWRLAGIADPYAYVDHVITAEDGLGLLPGLLVQPRLYSSSDLAENLVSGLTWVVATHPGSVGIGLDEGMRARTTAPRQVTADLDSAVLVVDGRHLTWAGAPTVGWQTSALEGAILDILGPGRSMDLSP